jgi:hypothetical protein
VEVNLEAVNGGGEIDPCALLIFMEGEALYTDPGLGW